MGWDYFAWKFPLFAYVYFIHSFHNISSICYIFTNLSNIIHTFNSKLPTLIPEAAPELAKPIKCPDPILLANNDAPT